MSEQGASSGAHAEPVARAGDDALLAASQAGDEEAFMTLAGRHHRGLRALAGCWPGGSYEAERDVASGWLGLLRAPVPPVPAWHPPVRARAAQAVADAAVARTHAAPDPGPPPAPIGLRFFGSEHELWPGEWADPPRPWGSIADRRLAQPDVPRLLARALHELGIAQSAIVTLHDVHGWPLEDCAIALRCSDGLARRLLRAGREGLRAVIEAEVDAR
jgi:DNA-directed RNA polymerase specialized sigma24 family protein